MQGRKRNLTQRRKDAEIQRWVAKAVYTTSSPIENGRNFDNVLCAFAPLREVPSFSFSFARAVPDLT
jgi:hypothetical protein